MSVLIKGIDLPEAYTSAWLTVFECVGEHTFIKTHKVSAEQMQAIPPHGRLIDADAVKEDMADKCDCETWVGIEEAIKCADAAPVVIPADRSIEAEEGETHEIDRR